MRQTLAALLLAVAVLAAALGSRPASGMCIKFGDTLDVLPADGATEVPVDTVLRVLLSADWFETDRARLAEELRLRGPEGQLVELDPVEVSGRTLLLRPSAPLQPSTTYTIELVELWQDGQPQDVGVRHILAEAAANPALHDSPNASAPATLRWTGRQRFTTSGSTAHTPPLPRFMDPRYSNLRPGCGHDGEATWGRLQLAEDLGAAELVEVEVEGAGVLWRGTRGPSLPGDSTPPSLRFHIGDGGCIIPPGTHFDASSPPRLRARTRASNDVPGPWTPWILARLPDDATDRAHEPAHDAPHEVSEARRRHDALWSEAYFDFSWDAPRKERASPLASCPGGLSWLEGPDLHLEARHRTAGRRSHTDIEPVSDGFLTLLRRDSPPGSEGPREVPVLTHVHADGRLESLPLPEDADRPQLWSGPRGPLLLGTVGAGPDSSYLVLHGLSDGGEARWRRVFAGEAHPSAPTVATSGSHILLAWTQTTWTREPRTEHLQPRWAVLDADGTVLAEVEGEGLGGARLVETLPREGGGWWLLLDARGPDDPDHPEGGPWELAPGRWRVALGPMGTAGEPVSVALPMNPELLSRGTHHRLRQPDGQLALQALDADWTPVGVALQPAAGLGTAVDLGEAQLVVGIDLGEGQQLAVCENDRCDRPWDPLPGHRLHGATVAPAGPDSAWIVADVAANEGWMPVTGRLGCTLETP